MIESEIMEILNFCNKHGITFNFWPENNIYFCDSFNPNEIILRLEQVNDLNICTLKNEYFKYLHRLNEQETTFPLNLPLHNQVYA
jgi:hypothetical protein